MLPILAGAVLSGVGLFALSTEKVDNLYTDYIRNEDIRSSFNKYKSKDKDVEMFKINYLEEKDTLTVVIDFAPDDSKEYFGSVCKYIFTKKPNNILCMDHFKYKNPYNLKFSKEDIKNSNNIVVEFLKEKEFKIKSIDSEAAFRAKRNDLLILDQFLHSGKEAGILIEKTEEEK